MSSPAGPWTAGPWTGTGATAPIEVEIEHLVLRGVQEADVPQVLEVFRRRLAQLLADPATPRTPVTDARVPGPDDPESPVRGPGGERLGRELAEAVARVVRR
ncbi:hypothetical protein ACIRST_14495 [Kitasatospora sp. NPDC101447]|uniref:hypothetical protein n=1 Tax=Kitasatospora sp. NPDC101447 TaxID=3364102 RepID=UPI0037FB0B4F